ncbi:MAG: DUF1499 domain-containing protein [Pseudomonadales bacterium]|nr:DUF1499 domain-containing protein [Pseudomonadales bacterium]
MSELASADNPAAGRTWWSRAILVGAVVAAALLPIGALGTRLEIWSFRGGFLLLAAGAVLAAIGLVVGIAGIIAAKRRRLRDDKPAVYLGTLISLLIVGLVGVQFFQASSVPPIHNISTDVADPPAFDKIVALRGEGTNSLDYDADALGPVQQQAYPWVRTLVTPRVPEDAIRQAVRTLEGMGLVIVHVDETAGLVEATDTTFWFGFKDDVVVRIRPDTSGGSRVDLRSVSRVGMSDLGVNARRIGQFLDRFEKA